MKKNSNLPENSQEKKITRKKAIQKVGKYAAFTAASMMLLMNPVDSTAKDKSKKPLNPRKH